jgi:hypothetical protein
VLPRRPSLLDRGALLLVGAAAVVAAHPICNLLFRCGCTWFSTEHCNIHTPSTPDCPWCTQPLVFAAAGLLWLGGAVLGRRLARRLGPSAGRALLFTSLGLVAGILISGVVTVLLTGYPRLLVWNLSR